MQLNITTYDVLEKFDNMTQTGELIYYSNKSVIFITRMMTYIHVFYLFFFLY